MNLKLSEVISNEQVEFVIQNTNKIKVIDTLITPPEPGNENLMLLDLFFDIDITKYGGKECKILWMDNLLVKQTLTAHGDNNNILTITFNAESGSTLDYSVFDDAIAIDEANEVFIELYDGIEQSNKIIPVNKAKFRIEDIDIDLSNFTEATY